VHTSSERFTFSIDASCPLGGTARRSDDFSNHADAKPMGVTGARSLLAADTTDSSMAQDPEVAESGVRAAVWRDGDIDSCRGEADKADQRREGMRSL
jgi:hypothetical protein